MVLRGGGVNCYQDEGAGDGVGGRVSAPPSLCRQIGRMGTKHNHRIHHHPVMANELSPMNLQYEKVSQGIKDCLKKVTYREKVAL